jgi:hypothetical protein
VKDGTTGTDLRGLSDVFIVKLDGWTKKSSVNRAEAFRQLIELGLKV